MVAWKTSLLLYSFTLLSYSVPRPCVSHNRALKPNGDALEPTRTILSLSEPSNLLSIGVKTPFGLLHVPMEVTLARSKPP
jgi:hypothetical protein